MQQGKIIAVEFSYSVINFVRNAGKNRVKLVSSHCLHQLKGIIFVSVLKEKYFV